MISPLCGPMLAALLAGQAPPAGAAAGPDLAAIMRAMAGEIAMKTPDGRGRFERLDEPVSRFSDPARKFSDGTVWAFGKTGRPAALVTFSLEKARDGHLQWIEELTAISAGAFEAELPTPIGPRRWTPTEPERPWRAIAPAPPPVDDPARRLRPIKEIARRFRAYEFWSGQGTDDHAAGERYELRLLPQPILRYDDPAAGILDGAIFLFSFGTNPEIALVIEARRDGDGPASWSYTMGRIAAARVLVRLDDKEVADWERVKGAFLAMPYDALVIPAPELEK